MPHMSDFPAPDRELQHGFFERPTATVARDLLGCLIVSHAGGAATGGRIVETEAYLGSDDPGSHASTRGITARNAIMYAAPGRAYVYFTYGAHHMLNLVTESEGTAGAVLIRAIEPLFGVDVMTQRRAGRPFRELTSGPGKVAAALGLDLSDNGIPLGEGHLAVYDGARPRARDVGVSGRIGLSAGHDLDLRFFITGSEFVSRGRTGPPQPRPRADHPAPSARKGTT